MSKLIQIKELHTNHFNNCKSTNIFTDRQLLNSVNGKNLRTTYTVTCLDNKRRRVFADVTVFDYVLWVNMDNEKTILCDPITLKPVSFSGLNDLIEA